MLENIPGWAYISAGAALVLILFFVFRRKKQKTSQKSSQPKPLTLGLEKTRRLFSARLAEIFSGHRTVDEESLAALEELLISADVGVNATQKLLNQLREDLGKSSESNIHLLKEYLSKEILKILHITEEDLEPAQKPHVLMFVGINGVGKTTSIGKLAHRYSHEGNKILLAAADTFRAGAVDQLKRWGERVGIETLAQQEGADPASVAFDAVKAAQARDIDCVIIDTAGRLHTKVNLMEELKKIKRVLNKAMEGAPHEVFLVIDATQGQNAVHQARQFHEAVGLTGIILTKLDSTSKGGIVISIVDELKVPIAYIGVGEALEDLRPFDAREFVDALLA
ncbi:MAG: signal recognition particle-docking protein FtsY [Deltaproteobacteria bacterium]|nr:signal recognition particle-docking protein FtsY [Deltaproteobacteria bacterium]